MKQKTHSASARFERLESRMLLSAGALDHPMAAGAMVMADSVTGTATGAAATSGWTTLAPAPMTLFESEGAAASGKLYLFGGFYDNKVHTTWTVYSYNPATNRWSTLPHTPAPETHVGTATDGHTVYFAGGFRGNWFGHASSDLWEYDTASGKWTQGPSLPKAVGAGALVLVGRQLHFFAGLLGDGTTDSASHWSLDLDHPSAGWVQRADLPDPRNHLGYAALDGKIYAICGQHALDEQTGQDARVDVYDPATDAWSAAAPLPVPRSHLHNSTVVYNGTILCIGGSDRGDLSSDQILQYDPARDAWSQVGTLPAPRSAAVAQIVGDQLIVATGTPTAADPQTSVWELPLSSLAQVSAPAPAPGPDLSPSITSALPASAVQSRPITARTQITNKGSAAAKGKVTVKLYLSSDPVLDANDIALATRTRRLRLPAGASAGMKFNTAVPISAPAGDDYILAGIDGSAIGDVNASNDVAASATTIRVSPPSVTFAGTIAAPTGPLSPGRHGAVRAQLQNTGNVTWHGPVQITINAVSTSATNVVTLLHKQRRLKLIPGVARPMHLRIKWPPDIAPGDYALQLLLTPARATSDTSPPINLGSSPLFMLP